MSVYDLHDDRTGPPRNEIRSRGRAATSAAHGEQELRQRTVADGATPLAEFPWSDGVVGLGFIPSELGLPVDWRWSSNRADAGR